MDSYDVLLAISEVGIGMAGFGGIVAGLGYRVQAGWSEQDRIRLIYMATTSLLVTFSCFFPYIFSHLGFNQPLMASAWFLLPFVLVNVFSQIWIYRSGIPEGYNPLATMLLSLAQLSTLLAVVLLLANRPIGTPFATYLICVVLLLLQASILFVRLLITSFRKAS
jgi:hypothetical protein